MRHRRIPCKARRRRRRRYADRDAGRAARPRAGLDRHVALRRARRRRPGGLGLGRRGGRRGHARGGLGRRLGGRVRAVRPAVSRRLLAAGAGAQRRRRRRRGAGRCDRAQRTRRAGVLGRHLAGATQAHVRRPRAGAAVRRAGIDLQPRDRPRPAGDRVARRREPLAPVLGAAVPRRDRRPQRPRHQLLQEPAPVRDARPPFQTGNDTEFVAVYLADRMAAGVPLDEAVRDSIDDLDGSFTYLVSTADGFGVARDRFSTKPCLVAETDDWVAVVSEGIALAEAFGDGADFDTYELAGGEARAWTR